MYRAPFRHTLSALVMLSLSALTQAASFAGHVTLPDGQPLSGALITVFNEAKDRKETVYTALNGSYALRTDFKGKLTVRARSHRLQDATQSLAVGHDKTVVVNFKMAPFTNAVALSDSLTASAHLTQVQWPNPQVRTTFISQCNYCHQMGNALTRVPKELSAWESTVARMEGYGALLTNTESHTIAKTLQQSFDGKAVQAMQKYLVSDELSRAKVMEWHVGDGMSFIHDTDVGEDGLLYGTDEGHDILWTLNRQTGVIKKHPLPDIDLPQGGLFAAAQLPLGVFTGKHGPHSMAQAKDGRIWITNALSSTLMSFDPKSAQFKTYPIDRSALYLHTIRIDQQGVVWCTAAASNKVVRFDPATEQSTVIELPHNGVMRWMVDKTFPTLLKLVSARWPGENKHVAYSPHKLVLGRMMFNMPYGIDVNPKDGSIWYAKLLANKIGRIDPKTLAIEEFDTPFGGPRRPRFDKNGVLWIPAFDDNALMRFDPTSRRFESFKLPLLAASEYETPYALNVHPTTGEVWITSNQSDRVLRFNPVSKTFIAYPSPTRVTWLRDLVFTKEGHVCSSSSNLPAYGIEDGRNAFFCIDPVGGEKDRLALTPPEPKGSPTKH